MTNTATAKQVSFLSTLLAERAVPQVQRDALANLNGLSTRQASDAISALLRLPKAPKAAPKAPVNDDMARALEGVPNAMYAVPASVANIVLRDAQVDDMLFVRIKTYRETRYVRRLHGAPGDFATSRLTRRDTLAILTLIGQDSLHYAQEFGKHYSVCGKCGAPLTDAESRALNMGPVCRKAWGL